MLDMFRSLIDNGLVRAQILKGLRFLAASASAVLTAWLGNFLVNNGLDHATAMTYALSLGGMAATLIIWLGSLALSLLDAKKVHVQLQASAAVGHVVPVSGVIKVPSVDQVIADAQAGKI